LDWLKEPPKFDTQFSNGRLAAPFSLVMVQSIPLMTVKVKGGQQQDYLSGASLSAVPSSGIARGWLLVTP
jgi:hypothetical protein